MRLYPFIHGQYPLLNELRSSKVVKIKIKINLHSRLLWHRHLCKVSNNYKISVAVVLPCSNFHSLFTVRTLTSKFLGPCLTLKPLLSRYLVSGCFCLNRIGYINWLNQCTRSLHSENNFSWKKYLRCSMQTSACLPLYFYHSFSWSMKNKQNHDKHF